MQNPSNPNRTKESLSIIARCLYTRGYYIENGERKGVLISGVSLERGSTIVKQMGEMENEGERERERD